MLLEISSGRASGPLIVLVLAGLLISEVSPSDASGRARSCKVRGSVTLDESATYRLYRKRGARYLCRIASGTTEKLNERSEDGDGGALIGIDGADVGGRYFAYETLTVDASNTVELHVTSPGWRTATPFAYAAEPRGEVDGNLQPDVLDLNMRADGLIAWIATTSEVGGYRDGTAIPKRQVLFARVRRSRSPLEPRMLAASVSIDPGSLAVGADRIYWTEAGEAKSSTT
jgi:hypothetical protein